MHFFSNSANKQMNKQTNRSDNKTLLLVQELFYRHGSQFLHLSFLCILFTPFPHGSLRTPFPRNYSRNSRDHASIFVSCNIQSCALSSSLIIAHHKPRAPKSCDSCNIADSTVFVHIDPVKQNP